MKYIRMKRIISYRSLYKLRSVGEKIFAVDYCGESYEFIKEADTIEELCDMFIVNFDLGSHEYHDKKPTFEDAKRFVEEYLPKTAKVHGVYGAIWTDKGLIYVAKMNEKGELELK